MKVVECRPGVAGVLCYESRQRARPASARRPNTRATPVSLDGVYNRRAGDFKPPVTLPKVALIFPRIGQPSPDEVAGAAADQQTGHRLGRRKDCLEGLLLGKTAEVGNRPGRKHGPDFAERERAGDVEEVAQGG